jgi:hypothetical protein
MATFNRTNISKLGDVSYERADGAKGRVLFSKGCFASDSPETLEIGGDGLSEPKPKPIKLTPEERAAARAAKVPDTPEQKLAKIAKAKEALDARAAKLQAEMAL